MKLTLEDVGVPVAGLAGDAEPIAIGIAAQKIVDRALRTKGAA